MKKKWKNIVAAAMAVLMACPPAALAADTGDAGGETTTDPTDPPATQTGTAEVSFNGATGASVPKGGTISSGDSETYTIEVEQDERRLTEINVEITTRDTTRSVGSIQLSGDRKSGEAMGLAASVNGWPEGKGKCELTLNTAELKEDVDVEVLCKTEKRDTYTAEIEKNSHATITGGNSENEYYDGDTVTLSIKPDSGYELRSLNMTYDDSETTVSGSTTWKDWKVSWSATGETKITGAVHGDLQVRAEVEALPETYRVRIDVDDGLELERPSSSSTTVEQGDSVYVRVSVRDGYVLSDMTVQYGKSYASWATGQTFLVMGGPRVPVKEKSDEVSFTLSEITEDISIYMTADYDENNIPVETDEGSRINIDTDCGDTVSRGEDAEFYISTTSDRYSVRRLTLQIGDERATVDPDDGEIRVGRRTYEIEDTGDGEYTLYVDNITEPVRVSATSTGSSTVSRPSLTIRSSSHMKITKSVSSSRIDEGDDVSFYFTPDKNYQIDEITVKLGDNSRTVGADKTSVRVGGQTYTMRRSASGVVTLYLTDVDQNVTVSGRAYYSKDTVVEPTDPVNPNNPDTTSQARLNTSARNAFMSGYTDGSFRPENAMTRAEAVVMLYNLSDIRVNGSFQHTFRDVAAGTWYAQAVNTFAASGILDSTTYFYPNASITRADFVELLYRLSGWPSVSGSTTRFTDIGGSSSSTAIRYAVSRGWISGYSDGTFRPYNSIARSEAATLMTKALGRTAGGSAVYYTDVPQSYWAYRYIQLASSNI